MITKKEIEEYNKENSINMSKEAIGQALACCKSIEDYDFHYKLFNYYIDVIDKVFSKYSLFDFDINEEVKVVNLNNISYDFEYVELDFIKFNSYHLEELNTIFNIESFEFVSCKGVSEVLVDLKVNHEYLKGMYSLHIESDEEED